MADRDAAVGRADSQSRPLLSPEIHPRTLCRVAGTPRVLGSYFPRFGGKSDSDDPSEPEKWWSKPGGTAGSHRNRDGSWAKGHPGGPGRPRSGRNFRTILLDLPPTASRAEVIAKVLGCKPADVPDLPDEELVIWLRREQALRGHEDALKDVLERLFPKPRRVEVSGPEGAPIRQAVVGRGQDPDESQAAADLMEAIEGDL